MTDITQYWDENFISIVKFILHIHLYYSEVLYAGSLKSFIYFDHTYESGIILFYFMSSYGIVFDSVGTEP